MKKKEKLLKSKVAVITGASQGFGESLARLLSSRSKVPVELKISTIRSDFRPFIKEKMEENIS